MTEKHVLTGRKHDMLGNQTFEVRRPLRKLSHQSWKAFDVFDKQILSKLQTTYSSVQGFQKWSNSDGGYSTNKWSTWKVSYVPFALTARTSNVWLPSLSCLRPVRTCFTVTCPRLDENDGINVLHQCFCTLYHSEGNKNVGLATCVHVDWSLEFVDLWNMTTQ